MIKDYNVLNTKGDKIVDVNQLSKGSHVKITAVCDICNREKETLYKIYLKMIEYDGLYYCVKCRDIKTSKSNIENYGVKNVMQISDIKEKMYETNIEKYGHMCSVQSDEIKEKSKNNIIEKYDNLENYYSLMTKNRKKSCIKKYGVDNVMKVENIFQKQIKTMLKNYGVENISNFIKSKEYNNFLAYSLLVRKYTNRNKKQLFETWNGYDYYDNEYIKENFNLSPNSKNYPTIDHKTSIYEGYKNNIPAYELSFIHNLCITKRTINSSKNRKSLEEFTKINNYKMKTKIICILDRSGSMSSIINDAIGGFNTFLQDQKEIDGECKMDILLFDTEFNKIVNNVDIREVSELNRKTYSPGGGTSLYDAIGMSIENELDFLSENPKNRSDKTLCVILTDGEENASKKFNQQKIKLMISEMEEQFKWDFIFLAANQDAVLTADSIGISAGKSMNWNANGDGIHVAYASISKATKYYRTTTNDSYDNIFKDSENDYDGNFIF